ncbi:phage tail family protein [Neobacillus sp. DY30]|uniref:phage tail family protein n=1 Tax=Neobacillus sp. DY30 TaxID=3047871 RepID=UPI0024C04F20|nr:phage tail family protein [Neobacillus sp. DY30]WHY01879.1 phage tail family protein [Neobacillus sp. DY30]
MNTIIERLDGTVYDLEELGITTRDFVVSSLTPRHSFEIVQGRHGTVDMGTEYDPRNITVSFYAKAVDQEDYARLRHEVFRMFQTAEAFYVTESRHPDKRWLVKVAAPFSPEQQQLYGFFVVELVTVEQPFAESVLTTLDPNTAAAQITGTGSREINYRHSASSFEIYNEGDVAVNPREMPLVITFKGASTNLKITNLTTGDVWQYTGTTAVSDTVKLDGIRATKNGLSIFRNTNRKLIRLAEGWNDFQITGATGAYEITFDFRFYTI